MRVLEEVLFTNSGRILGFYSSDLKLKPYDFFEPLPKIKSLIEGDNFQSERVSCTHLFPQSSNLDQENWSLIVANLFYL